MAGFRTQYTRLNSNSDDPEEDLPPQGFDIAARGFEEVEKGICIFLQYSMYISLCIYVYPSFVTVCFLGGKLCTIFWIYEIQALIIFAYSKFE